MENIQSFFNLSTHVYMLVKHFFIIFQVLYKGIDGSVSKKYNIYRIWNIFLDILSIGYTLDCS